MAVSAVRGCSYPVRPILHYSRQLLSVVAISQQFSVVELVRFPAALIAFSNVPTAEIHLAGFDPAWIGNR
jgi:hypothetical protein